MIAFPKTASGADPLTGAPAPVDTAQLAELGLRSHRAAAKLTLRTRAGLPIGGET